MGVNGFFSLVATKSPEAREFLTDSSSVVGKRLGIDAPILLHRARAAQSLEWAYLAYISEHLQWLRTMRCTAVFVFDGNGAHEAKIEEASKRATRRSEQQDALDTWRKRLEYATSWDEIGECRAKIEQYSRACVHISPLERAYMKDLISALGFAWHDAPGEAEQLLATLQINNYIDEIITEDSDAIICGAFSIIRNFWNLRTMKDNQCIPPQRLHKSAILQSLDAEHVHLRIASVLAGCDFAPKIKNIGIVKALKSAKKDATLSNCLRSLTKCATISPESLGRYERAIALLSPCDLKAEMHADLARRDDIDRKAVAILIEKVERNGEPWELRSSLLDRSRIPLHALLPWQWHPDDNERVSARSAA